MRFQTLESGERESWGPWPGFTDSLEEWKGRSDGLLAHVFFHRNANFALSTFAFAVEGWIFYSAVNSVVPQVVLNLGFETDSWAISVRQLSYTILTMFASIPITWYATAFKDLKTPLLATFGIFLVVYVIPQPPFAPVRVAAPIITELTFRIRSICYACIKPTWNSAQIVFNILAGIGQSGPLTLLVACIQFTAPHAYLSTAT